jgi:hypothetical protein
MGSSPTRPTTFDQHLWSSASRCTASLVAFLVAVCRFRGEIVYLAAASGPGMSRAAVFYGRQVGERGERHWNVFGDSGDTPPGKCPW